MSFALHPAENEAQDPDTALGVLRQLALDSIQSGRVTTHYRPEHSSRANQLHRLHLALSTFAQDSLRVAPLTRVAVLERDDWTKLTPLPYGFPNNFGPPANLILYAAAMPPAVGVDTVLTDAARDAVYMGHEGGHVLTWALMPRDMLDSIRGMDDRLSPDLRARFARFDSIPGWYWEFTATYLGIAFLRTNDSQMAQAMARYVQTLAGLATPRYRSLDQWFETMMTVRSESGRPYVTTAEGNLNFSWYQGVVGAIAEHVHSARGLGYVSQIRRWTSGEAGRTSVDLIEEIESFAPGLIPKLDRLGVVWRTRSD